MSRVLQTVLLVGILVLLAGCNSMRENSRQMVDVFKPGDYADWNEDPMSDPWVQQVGVEARGHRPRESINEPRWFHNLLTTEKAREIERSTGFDVP